MENFSLTAATSPLVVVETDESGARSSVIVAFLAERDGDDVRVSPVVVSHEPTGSLLRVVRDRGPGYAALVPCPTTAGLPIADVEGIARELSAAKGQPKRMVSRSRI
jgi:hypothetical protein